MTVNKPLIAIYLSGLTLALPVAAKDSASEETKQAIKALQKRVETLESELEEQKTEAEDLAIELSQQTNRTAPNTFNPGIGVILNGKYLSASRSDYEFAMPGFFLGEEPGPGEPGLALGESELNMSASIDDKFIGSVTLAFGEETEVENAYLKTTALPDGFQMTFGRFFSSIGYLNSRHRHSDDFAHRPLAYQAFLGNNYGDDGVQLTWLAPTAIYWETGLEVFRGESFPAAGGANSGKGMTTLFTHIGDDINTSQSWRAGLSLLAAEVDGQESEETGESFSGDSDLWVLDFIWKWAPDGNSKVNNAKLQAEFFNRKQQGEFLDSAAQSLPVDTTQRGWYVQGVYQFMPQWRVGARFEKLEADQLPAGFTGSILDIEGHSPKQTSLMLDWSNSEFSRIRLQYTRDQAASESVNLWTLQYVAAFGAHSAHSF